MVWLPSSSNFYNTPTVMWLWYDSPVQHSHTSQSCLISLPSSKSHCLDLHRRLCIPDRQRKAKKPEQECNRQPVQTMNFGVHSKMATAGDMYLLGRNLFWIKKQLFLHFSKNCSITALAVSCLHGKHHTEVLSPEMTSRSNMSLRPSLKSSSMFSICVPALRRWELHHAVNV